MLIAPDADLVKTLKSLDKYLHNLKPVRRLNTLTRVQRELVQSITASVNLARGQVEFSVADEDAEAQIKGFKLAIEQLSVVREGILEASMHDLVDAVDVAQLTAMCDHCIDKLNLLTT